MAKWKKFIRNRIIRHCTRTNRRTRNRTRTSYEEVGLLLLRAAVVVVLLVALIIN